MSATAVRYDALRSLAFGSISGTYAAIGPATQHAMRLIKIVNNTNADITISFDGTTDNDYIPSNSFALYDFQTNSQSDLYFFLSLNTQVYIKGTPSAGSVYVTMIYAKGQ
jgi:hypothetical protein